jgi:DNA-binding beta-propeller fold protein YncE
MARFGLSRSSLLIAIAALLATVVSCKHELPKPAPPMPDGNFPAPVAKILLTKCATAGCHNEASYQISGGGLRMDSWEQLFAGGNTGAAIVPFQAENSPLLYFTNTHEEFGPLPPDNMKMPYNAPSLSREDYLVLRNWVLEGAPDKEGRIPFSSNAAGRQKVYLTMQGCDLIAVIDAEKKVVMRYIQVGKTPAIENPHCIRVSNDGRFAYVSFLGGEYIQKINTETDEVVDELNVGVGSWNVFQLSPDGNKLLLSDWRAQPNGRLLLISTHTMEVINQFAGVFHYPHGIASNADFTTFFITAQYGNTVYKLTTNNPGLKSISIDGTPPVITAGKRDPHEIIMSPDYTRYFLTCEASNEIRVMDVVADTLIKALPVGIKPQEIAISKVRPYVFVTCMEDDAAPGYKGSVYAINYQTYDVTKIEAPFYQPHGVAVDDQHGVLYVASRNANPDGPAPHHSSSCAGRNGYYYAFDLATFQRLPRRFEVGVEPYSADSRFK